jgi:hypothetical protein
MVPVERFCDAPAVAHGGHIKTHSFAPGYENGCWSRVRSETANDEFGIEGASRRCSGSFGFFLGGYNDWKRLRVRFLLWPPVARAGAGLAQARSRLARPGWPGAMPSAFDGLACACDSAGIHNARRAQASETGRRALGSNRQVDAGIEVGQFLFEFRLLSGHLVIQKRGFCGGDGTSTANPSIAWKSLSRFTRVALMARAVAAIQRSFSSVAGPGAVEPS